MTELVTYDDYVVEGRKAREEKDGAQWRLGDLALKVPKKYGKDTLGQYAADVGVPHNTLRGYRVVSRAYQNDIRISFSFLSFKHFQIAAAQEDRVDWLGKAQLAGWSCEQLHQEIKAAEKRERAELPLPEGVYAIVYADPPWQYDNSGFAQSAAQQYPTMSTEEICMMPIESRISDDAVLFLWVTAAFVPDGLNVLQSWGFEYKTCLVWKKDRAPGLGWYCNTKHELLFIGARGTGIHPSVKIDSVIEAPVTRHSEKPTIIYELIEAMYPQYPGRSLELFARNQREGWISWGNEIKDAKRN